MAWMTSRPHDFPQSDNETSFTDQLNATRVCPVLMQSPAVMINMTSRVHIHPTFGDACNNLVLEITKRFNSTSHDREKTIVHFAPGTSYQMPIGVGIGDGRQIQRDRPQVVYVGHEMAKQVAIYGKAKVVCIVQREATIDHGTYGLLAKLGRAVKAGRVLHVMIITEQSIAPEDLRKVREAFDGVSCRYVTLDY